jgi:hypothetical protein
MYIKYFVEEKLLLLLEFSASPQSTLKRSRWRQYANSLPTGFRRKNRKYLLERLHFTKRASPSFSSFWALLPPGSCLNNPDYRFGVQESRREKKFSGDYQRGSQGHKNDLQGSKA